jgi:DNA-binding protein Fis
VRPLSSAPVIVAHKCQFTCQIYGKKGPETYSIKGWERRVSEAFESALKYYVEDLHRMPSVEEYREMALHAIENPVR